MFSILTFNTAIQDIKILGQSVYRPVAYIQERLQELSAQLLDLGPDIICLQELFHPHLQEQFHESLKSEYPYVSEFAEQGFRLRLGHELLILSKMPLGKGRHLKFSNATIEERLFTSKGFYSTSINTPNGEVHLINMHMTAGGLRNHPEDEKMEKIRFYQIQQLIKAVSDKTPTILAGDLNAGPDTSQRNYQALMEAGFIDAFVETGNTGITWDPDNPLVASGNENHLPVQRIDHIFINQAALELLKPVDGNVVLNKNLVELSDGSKIPISDHYGLNIHFEIAG